MCISEAAPARRLASPALSLRVFAATSPTVITGSSPNSITAATATDITLAGTVWSGDLVTWAVDCSAVTPDQDPTDGSNQVTAFTVTGVNTYKLCYRASGLSDSVEQSGVTLNVVQYQAHLSGTAVSMFMFSNFLTVGGRTLAITLEGDTFVADSDSNEDNDKPQCWLKKACKHHW